MSHDRTRVIYRVNSHAICETLGITMDVFEYQTFIEGSFPLVYKKMSLDNKVDKLTKLVKLNQTLEGVNMPYPRQIFQPMV